MRLAEIRKEHKISQSELAKQIGYSQNMISQWENGTRDPNTETLKILANYFGVSVDYLIGRDKNTPEHLSKIDKEIIDIYGQLPEDKRKQAIEFAKFLLSRDGNATDKK